MCGIVGYIGRQQAAPILLEGLRRLEYRGYDSAGVSVLNGAELQTRKKKGKIDEGLVRRQMCGIEVEVRVARHKGFANNRRVFLHMYPELDSLCIPPFRGA